MARLLVGSLAVAAARPTTVLPLGDSITFGCGDNTFCGDQCAITRPYAQSGYRQFLWRMLSPGSATSPDWDFVGAQQNGPDDTDRDHEGNPGWKCEGLTGIKDHWVPLNPDVIMLMCGTNNMGIGLQQHEAALGHMETLLELIFNELPNTRLMLSTLIGSATGYGGQQHLPYNEGLRAFVKKYASAGHQIELVDMATETAIGESGCNPDYCCPAGIHPTIEGYPLLAQVWHDHLVGNRAGNVTVV